jgi:hypothetical protein
MKEEEEEEANKIIITIKTDLSLYLRKTALRQNV